jgi:diguanylate cyclase (GGDEF)-like protein
MLCTEAWLVLSLLLLSSAGWYWKNSQIRAELDKMRTHAQLDALTGVPSRRMLLPELQRRIMAIEAKGQSGLAVLFIDLDGFKQVNDRQGHASGDRLLKVAAGALHAKSRASDFVARYGGDEFVMIVDNVVHSEAVGKYAENLIRHANLAMAEATSCTVGVSIGIGLYPDDVQDAATLLVCADQALLAVKALKKKGKSKKDYLYYHQLVNTEYPGSTEGSLID